jgi:S-adenosylmethionine/arginine decarboxylase-like enzyme
MQKLFHQHLLIKAYCNQAPTTEYELNQWLRELVADINMTLVIEPRSYYVKTPGNEGLTGQCGLSTSHISVHLWTAEEPNVVQMDVYSCKCFETETVIEKLKEWDLISYEAMTIDRNDNFVVKEIQKIAIA